MISFKAVIWFSLIMLLCAKVIYEKAQDRRLCPTCWNTCMEYRSRFQEFNIDNMEAYCPDFINYLNNLKGKKDPPMISYAKIFHLEMVRPLKSAMFINTYHYRDCANYDCQYIRHTGFLTLYYDAYGRSCVTDRYLIDCSAPTTYFNKYALFKISDLGIPYLKDNEIINVEPDGKCDIYIGSTFPYAITLINMEDSPIVAEIQVNTNVIHLNVNAKDKLEHRYIPDQTTSIVIRCGASHARKHITYDKYSMCKSAFKDDYSQKILGTIHCTVIPRLYFTIFILILGIILILIAKLVPGVSWIIFLPLYVTFDRLQMWFFRKYTCPVCARVSWDYRLHNHSQCACSTFIIAGEEGIRHLQSCRFLYTEFRYRMALWATSKREIYLVSIITLSIMLAELTPIAFATDVNGTNIAGQKCYVRILTSISATFLPYLAWKILKYIYNIYKNCIYRNQLACHATIRHYLFVIIALTILIPLTYSNRIYCHLKCTDNWSNCSDRYSLKKVLCFDGTSFVTIKGCEICPDVKYIEKAQDNAIKEITHVDQVNSVSVTVKETNHNVFKYKIYVPVSQYMLIIIISMSVALSLLQNSNLWITSLASILMVSIAIVMIIDISLDIIDFIMFVSIVVMILTFSYFIIRCLVLMKSYCNDIKLLSMNINHINGYLGIIKQKRRILYKKKKRTTIAPSSMWPHNIMESKRESHLSNTHLELQEQVSHVKNEEQGTLADCNIRCRQIEVSEDLDACTIEAEGFYNPVAVETINKIASVNINNQFPLQTFSVKFKPPYPGCSTSDPTMNVTQCKKQTLNTEKDSIQQSNIHNSVHDAFNDSKNKHDTYPTNSNRTEPMVSKIFKTKPKKLNRNEFCIPNLDSQSVLRLSNHLINLKYTKRRCSIKFAHYTFNLVVGILLVILSFTVPFVQSDVIEETLKDLIQHEKIHLTEKGYQVHNVDFTNCVSVGVKSRDSVGWDNIQMPVRRNACYRYQLQDTQISIGILFKDIEWVSPANYMYTTCQLLKDQVAVSKVCPVIEDTSDTDCLEQIEGLYTMNMTQAIYTHANGCGLIGTTMFCGRCNVVPDVSTCIDVYEAHSFDIALTVCINMLAESYCKRIIGLEVADSDIFKFIFDFVRGRESLNFVYDRYVDAIYKGAIARSQTDEQLFGQPQFREDLRWLHGIKNMGAHLEHDWLYRNAEWRGTCYYNSWHLRETLKLDPACDLDKINMVYTEDIDSLGIQTISIKPPSGFQALTLSSFTANMKILDCHGCYKCGLYTLCELSIKSSTTTFANLACTNAPNFILKLTTSTTAHKVKTVSHSEHNTITCVLKSIQGNIVANSSYDYIATPDVRKVFIMRDPLQELSLVMPECTGLCQLQSMMTGLNPFKGLLILGGIVSSVIAIIICVLLGRCLSRGIRSLRDLNQIMTVQSPLEAQSRIYMIKNKSNELNNSTKKRS